MTEAIGWRIMTGWVWRFSSRRFLRQRKRKAGQARRKITPNVTPRPMPTIAPSDREYDRECASDVELLEGTAGVPAGMKEVDNVDLVEGWAEPLDGMMERPEVNEAVVAGGVKNKQVQAELTAIVERLQFSRYVGIADGLVFMVAV